MFTTAVLFILALAMVLTVILEGLTPHRAEELNRR
jgi:hypothetical protein